MQFQAAWVRTAAPTSSEGLEKYLASGLLKGIGPHFARRLVAAFGADVFDVIETAPDRLRDVEGIGPQRARGSATAGARSAPCATSWSSCTASASARRGRSASTRPTASTRSRSCATTRIGSPATSTASASSLADSGGEAGDRGDGDDPHPRRGRLRAGQGDGRRPLRPARRRADRRRRRRCSRCRPRWSRRRSRSRSARGPWSAIADPAPMVPQALVFLADAARRRARHRGAPDGDCCRRDALAGDRRRQGAGLGRARSRGSRWPASSGRGALALRRSCW